MSRGYVGARPKQLITPSDPIWSDVAGYWRLGGNYLDYSGNGHDGTAYGTPTAVVSPLGSATQFDGTDDYVSVGTLGNFGSQNLGEFSIACWVKTSVTNAKMSLCGDVNDGLTTSFQIFFNEDHTETLSAGKMRFYLRDNTGHILAKATTNNTGICNGNWHFAAFTAKGSTNALVVYVDSVSVALTTQVLTTPVTFSNFQYPFFLGAINGRGTADRYFDGAIDEFLLVKRVLTQTEINRLYAGAANSTGVYSLSEHYEEKMRGGI